MTTERQQQLTGILHQQAVKNAGPLRGNPLANLSLSGPHDALTYSHEGHRYARGSPHTLR
jgi:hypothetical protein